MCCWDAQRLEAGRRPRRPYLSLGADHARVGVARPALVGIGVRVGAACPGLATPSTGGTLGRARRGKPVQVGAGKAFSAREGVWSHLLASAGLVTMRKAKAA